MSFKLLIVKVFSILIFSLGLGCSFAQKTLLPLDDGWMFADQDSLMLFRSASVPGSVYTDLMYHGIIADPFVKDNEKQVQWVSQKTWVYLKHFDVNASLMRNYAQVQLLLEGVDTYADVFLNDSLILSCDNAFRPWSVDVKSLLQTSGNILKIVFPPVDSILQAYSSEYPYELPENLRVYARKPQFQFGWDWAPTIRDITLFKPVSLRFWNGFLLENLICKTEINTDQSGSLAGFLCIQNKISEDASSFELIVKDKHTGKEWLRQQLVQKGDSQLHYRINVSDIERWHPDHPKFYDLIFTLVHPQYGSQSIEKRIGFKDIKLVQQEDSVGSSFYFELNGRPIFCKGVNWVPADVFRHRITYERYAKLLTMAADAGYNMIRVWGGGWYEEQDFYNLCDSLGLLVWQDFMFACSMYPFDDRFLHSVQQEVEYQLTELSSHPSIALWCGNNENSEGWFNWGWQRKYGYSSQDSTAIWEGNHDLFSRKILQWGKPYGMKSSLYHPSSPTTGWGRAAAYTQGDVHYWGVWWNNEPFDNYFRRVGRFVSEYGFQGYPVLSTLAYMMQGKVDSLNHPYILQHQKHPRGAQTIQRYMERDFFVPKKLENYIYLSAMQQSEGVGKAFVAHRLAMPYCMGTLFWQMNDCWPSISWSAIDYFDRPKLLYFQSKRLFKEVAPFIVKVEDSVSFYVSNLSEQEFQGMVVLGFFNVQTEELSYDTLWVSVGAMQNKRINIRPYVQSEQIVYGIQLHDAKQVIVGHYTLFDDYKSIQSETDSAVQITCRNVPESDYLYEMSLSSIRPIFCLSFESEAFSVSDNGFHLFPGFSYTVGVEKNTQSSTHPCDQLKIKFLNQIISLK